MYWRCNILHYHQNWNGKLFRCLFCSFTGKNVHTRNLSHFPKSITNSFCRLGFESRIRFLVPAEVMITEWQQCRCSCQLHCIAYVAHKSSSPFHTSMWRWSLNHTMKYHFTIVKWLHLMIIMPVVCGVRRDRRSETTRLRRRDHSGVYRSGYCGK